MKYINSLSLALLALGFSATSIRALELPEQLGNHAVLQQQADAKLWGWAAPGATVTVTPSWDGKTYTAKADKEGRWNLRVATPKASYTPYEITFTEGKESTTISDILIGEVWFAAGQSNMEMPMDGFISQPIDGAGADIARSHLLRDKVRMAYLQRWDHWDPQERVTGPWMVASPENTRKFSAQGFYFARELNNLIDVPVGIICSTYGGTQVEGWMPRDLVESLGFDFKAMQKEPDRQPAFYYSTKYNTLVHPVIGYTIKGILWNQGESNIQNADQYCRLLTAMVDRWRKDWGDYENALPFYQTENPGFGWGKPEETFAAMVREQQHIAADSIPNSGITCTNDLTYPYEVDVIHGSRKREIGERMAWQVAERQYGIEGMPWRCPEFKSMTKGNDGTVRLQFDNFGSGLTPNVGNVDGFEVAGEDGVFHKADARVDWFKQDVILSCAEVPEIKDIRYCFKNFQIGALRNSDGMPAVPFRTDSYEK